MKSLFLIKLFKKSKLLFFSTVIFIVFQAFFTIRGIETFPFLNYGMYSELNQFPDTILIVNLINKKKESKQKIDIEKNRLLNFIIYKKNGDPLEDVYIKRFDFIKNSKMYKVLFKRIINTSYEMKSYKHVPFIESEILEYVIKNNKWKCTNVIK